MRQSAASDGTGLVKRESPLDFMIAFTSAILVSNLQLRSNHGLERLTIKSFSTLPVGCAESNEGTDPLIVACVYPNQSFTKNDKSRPWQGKMARSEWKIKVSPRRCTRRPTPGDSLLL